jgi:uncharacterized protein YbcI
MAIPQTESERPPQGLLASALANFVVGKLREYTGRGPTRARAYVNDDLVTVVLQDTLTKGERSLVRDGKAELVKSSRYAYQQTMRADLVTGVERLTGRTVVAFLSDNHFDPDVAVESFVLARIDERVNDSGEQAAPAARTGVSAG